MNLKKRNIIIIFIFIALLSYEKKVLLAQSGVNVQVKVYDVKLNPVAGVDLSIDDIATVRTNGNGIVFSQLPESSLPPKGIVVLNLDLEVESWNYSKGILEIILRKKSFRDVELTVTTSENRPIPGIRVSINSLKASTHITDARGNIKVKLPVNEDLRKPDLYSIRDYNLARITTEGNKVNLMLSKIIIDIPIPETPTTAEASEELNIENIGLDNLDSITSLTVLYSVIKKIDYTELDTIHKTQLDEKFNELMHQETQSNLRSIDAMSLISDSTVLDRDIEIVVEKIRVEEEQLRNAREEFELFTNQIETKLEEGGQQLSLEERKQLIQVVLNLREMLRRNEELFYKNNEFYKDEVDALLGQLANIHELEDLLVQSEDSYTRTKEQLIYVVFGFMSFLGLSILLIYLVKTLRSQKFQLTAANEEVNRVNSSLEDLVAEKTESLELINKDLDTFLYRSSHNLKRPLTSIRGLASIAEITLESEAIALFDKVVLTTKEMEKMLDKLSMMNHINQPVNFSPINFSEIMDKLNKQFNEAIEANNITFTTDIQENIEFNSFPMVIEIMLANLLENAFFFSRYNQAHSPAVNLKVSQNSGKKLQIVVSDNGSGIAPEVQEKIWDMFYIGSDLSKGNGLGLFISKKSVEALHGEIILNSKIGEYTAFKIILPLLKTSKKNKR